MRKHDAASLKRGTSLAGAVAKAGSPAALARLLGVRPETVRGWQRRGITKGGQKLLAELSERQKLTRAEQKGKRQTFDLMFKLAGERGDLRRSRSKEGVRAGPRTSGYSYTKAIGEMLTHELIAEIDAWMLSRRRRFPFFQAVAVATEYTKQKFKGYKTVIRQVAGVEESGDFAVEEQIATRRSAKLSEVRGELTAKLEDAIEEGALVYIHEVTLHNYRLRTDEERLAWESGKRSLRRKKAKRKARKKATPHVEKEPKKTWPKKKPSKSKKASTSKNSLATSRKKPAKSTKVMPLKTAQARTPSRQAPKKSAKRGASPARSASTRLRTTLSSSKRANAKASRPKTSASRSLLTKSKKSTTKQKSSSWVTPKTRTSTKKTLAKKTHRATVTTKTTKKTSKATSSRRNRK